MRRIISIVATLGLAASAAAAQTPTSPTSATRQIELPDTLGANFSIADSARVPGTAADFDFLVGMWHFRFQQRNANGTWNNAFSGHWWAERKQTANAFLEDHWRADNTRAPMATSTYTYRVYNPQRKLWEMQGVNSEAGAWDPGLAWSDGANRYLIQHYGSTIMRIRYFNITDNAFLWRADASDDNGKTWLRDRWTISATRVGK